MNQATTDYRLKQVDFIEAGIELWAQLGFTVSAEEKQETLDEWLQPSQWHSGAHVFQRLARVAHESAQKLTIPLDKADEIVERIHHILQHSARNQLLDNYDSSLFDFLIDQYGTLLGTRLLQDEMAAECLGNLSVTSSSLQIFLTGCRKFETWDALAALILSWQKPQPIFTILFALAEVIEREDRTMVTQLCRAVFQHHKSVFTSYEQTFSDHEKFIDTIDDPEIWAAMVKNGDGEVRELLYERLSQRCEQDMTCEKYWDQILNTVMAKPDRLIDTPVKFVGRKIPDLFWRTGKPEQMAFAVCRYFDLLAVDFETYLEKIKECISCGRNLVKDSITRDNHDHIGPFSSMDVNTMMRLLDCRIDVVTPVLLSAASMRSHCQFEVIDWGDEDPQDNQYAKGLVHLKPFLEKVMAEPKLVAKLRADDVPVYVRPFLKTATDFEAMSSHLKLFVNKSQVARDFLAAGFKADLPIALLIPWFEDRRKGVRAFAVNTVLGQATPAIEVIQTALKASKLDHEQKLALFRRLAQAGIHTEIEAPEAAAGLASLLKQAKTIKTRKKKLFADLWQDAYVEQLQPLDNAAVRWILLLLDGTEKGQYIPEIASNLLSYVSEEARQHFAISLVQSWVNQCVPAKYSWILEVIRLYGNNELVELSFKYIRFWKEGVEESCAGRLLEGLALVNTAQSLAYIIEVYTKSGYGDKLKSSASDCLDKVARIRRINRSDLYDQLLREFGMTAEGLLLDVGPRCYLVQVLGDLSFRVINQDTGKTTKSLPKAKVDEDPKLRNKAEQNFNFLRSSLKSVVKQHAKRMHEAVIVGQKWPYAAWRLLLSEHPVLAIIAQGLIWTHCNEQNPVLGAFRITEDQSCIDVEDETLTLTESDIIGLWHPVNANDSECEAWRSHQKDYALNPIVDQLELPRYTLSAEELASDTIIRFNETTITTGDAKRLLSKWDYYDSGSGSYSDEFSRSFTNSSLLISVHFEDFKVYNRFEEWVVVTHFEVYGEGKLSLKQVPASMIAMILEQGMAFQRVAI